MQSKLFSALDLSNKRSKELFEDLKVFLQIDEQVILKLVNSFPNMLGITESAEGRDFIDELAKENNLNISTIQNGFAIFGFFFKNFEVEYFAGDTPESLAEDLITLGVLNHDDKQKFVKMIEILKSDLFDDIHNQFAELRTKKGVLPAFLNIHTSIELRAVLKNEIGEDQKAVDFEPEIIGLVPIISIAMVNDSEEGSIYNFQATLEDTKKIINKLESAVKIANRLKEKI